VWVVRNAKSQQEYKKVAKLPLIPAVRLPDGTGMQDSTPIMEYFDTLPNVTSSHPPGDLRFVSQLLEEYGDEWANKQMFHYRWHRPIDQRIVSLRLASEMLKDNASESILVQMSDGIRTRMSGRGFAVGSNEITGPMIEQSFRESMAQLEKHLSTRTFLFGTKPSFGDFGLGAQIYQALIDPTAGKILLLHHPRVVEWCTSMLSPSQSLAHSGAFESWDTLAPTLEPFLEDHVGDIFLKWMDANHRCVQSKSKECVVALRYGTWKNVVLGPQKYQKKSLKVLREKFAKARTKSLDLLLKRTGCFDTLAKTSSSSSSSSKL
jgi:glutathione S-transferase